MFEKLKSKIISREKSITGLRDYSTGFYGINSGFSGVWDKGSIYDNSYASVKAIANAFVEIRPYTINARGKEIETSLSRALYNPNDRMSPAMFRETLATMALIHKKVYILVHHKKGREVFAGGLKLTPDNIAGFTFLEGIVETVIEGKKTFTHPYYGTLSEKDVIEITVGVNPYNLSAGYSPATAIKKWASVDDYIVAYEAGLFENGAVPAGQFVITAKSPESFKQIVADMQRRHRGSGKNNNVQYIYKPIDPITGLAQSAQVEWIPFSLPNNNLALSDIFKQVNEKLDSAYGVPASIRGVSKNNNYASAAVDEAHFMKFTVKPFATKIWDSFTHELNRITGGLGYAITFDMDEVSLADEKKVLAETKKIEIDILTAGLSAGYSAEQIIKGFGLTIDMDALKAVDLDEKSKKKQCSCEIKAKKAELDESQQPVKDELYGIIQKNIQARVDAVINELENQDEAGDFDYLALNEVAEDTSKDSQTLTVAMLAVLLVYMAKTGKNSYANGVSLLPDDASGATGYTLPEKTRNSYEKYLTEVVESFSKDNVASIKEILENSAKNGWSKNELKNALKDVMDTDEWRIERLAYNEERRAYNTADLDAMVELQDQTGVKITKTWETADAGACDFCREMAGSTVDVETAFILKDETLTLENGDIFLNDFVDMETAQLHPNCRCYMMYKVK